MDRQLWESLSPLLDRALDLDPDARATFLRSLPSGDPLVTRALRDLLHEHERVLASDFLETSPVVDDFPYSLRGHRVGAYTLERALGMGGMGTVWLARRSDGRFEAWVAVKLVNLSVLDATARERFAREGSVLARLAHPHIARLFDAGITAAGQPFLVLEYVKGTRIDEYADAHRLDVRGRIELFIQVAAAVAHAHTNLVVHRDLKPSNILVTDEGQVKLLDFGIAKLLRDESLGQDLTSPTAPPLTLRYAAPEQVVDAPVSTATDVYALGVLLYELLGGCHPTIRDESDPVAQMRVLAEREPLRLSEAVRLDQSSGAGIALARNTTLDRLQRACRGDLNVIVARTLKKSPSERYATVTALADDLRRHLRNEPVSVRADSLPYRIRTFARRHRLVLAAAASVVVALIAGTAIALVEARESARQRDRALADLRLAEAKNDFIDFLLSQATPNGKPISNADLLARGEALIPKRFAGDAPLRVHMLLALADRYQDNLQLDARNRVLAQAYHDSRSIADVSLRSMATCRWASQFADRGEFARALSLIDGVLPVLSKTAEYAETESRCRVFEATIAIQNRDGARAIPAAERAVSLEEHRGGAPGRLFEPLAALASAYSVASRWEAASRAFDRAMGALESDGLGNTRTAAVVLNNWAVMLNDAGQIADGAKPAARAVEIARAADTENGPNFGMLQTYSTALAATGDYASADRILDESLAKARALNSPRRLVLVLQAAIRSACDGGERARAERLVTEAHAVLGADPSPTEYSKAVVEISAARVALADGDARQAADLSDRAVRMFTTATSTRAGLVQAEIFHARSLNANGRFSEAATAADESVHEAASRLGGLAHSSFMGQALLELAAAKRGMGDTIASRAAIEGALEHLHAAIGFTGADVQRAEALRSTVDTPSH
ncbi:MAG TPA: serine/threonine-protein kinase [Vicinamibacterales bacterium]|nr:serine/threonine-protein kinase [Vicinamibacterales bacterium]